MKKTISTAFLCLVLLALYLPIFVLALYSFTDSANIGAIHSFSLQNYVTLFTKPELRDMIIGTLLLAIGSAVLSTVLGTLGAVGVLRRTFRKNIHWRGQSGACGQCGGCDGIFTVYSSHRSMQCG